jgi:hypothetical protein
VVGTTGSGDTSIAGFLSGLLHHDTLDDALTMGVAVGACNVEASDSLSGLQTWEETRQRVQMGWAQLPLSVDSPGWRWDSSKKMWTGPREASPRL